MNKIIDIVVRFTAQGLTEMTASLKNLNTQMGVLRKEQTSVNKGFDTMSNNAKKADKGIDETSKSAKRAKGAFSNFGKQLINTAAFLLRFAVVVTAFKALEFAIIGTAKAAMQFEAALKDLQAIANISNDELEKLSKNILDVAGTTRFTAIEVVGLNKSLARLGFSTDEIIQSTEAMARFAEATGESAEATAEFVGKQLRAFNVTAAESLRLTNEYTVAINNSALTLETLATSSQYAASISAALGVSIKEQNALLATLADNGLSASRAGTGLRKILLDLGADAGSLVPILDELAEKNLSVSKAEELVGDRAAGALLALVRQRDSVRDLINEQNTLTATFVASARQNSTFEGQIKALAAATDQLLIRFGNWVTQTEIILGLIEQLGADETLRGFNVIDEIGLTPEELEDVRKKLQEVNTELLPLSDQKGFLGFKVLDQDVVDFGKSIGLTGEQAIALAESAKKSDANLRAFVNTIKDFNEEAEAQESITTSVNNATKGFRSEISELTKAFSEEGLVYQEATSLFEERDDIYRRIGDAIDENQEKLNSLGEEEEAEIVRVNAIISALEGYQQTVINVGREVEKFEATPTFLVPQGVEEVEKSVGDTAKAIEEVFSLISSDVDEGLLRGDEIEAKIRDEYFPSIEKALRDGAISVSQSEELRKLGRDLLSVVISGEDSENQKEAISSLLGPFLNFVNDEILNATQRRLQAEQAAVDARYSYEEDRLNAFLQAGVISAEQFERQRLRLEKERIEKTNELERKRFNAEKANSIAQIAINTAVRATGAEAFLLPLILALGAAQTAIVASQRFVPTQFEQGGMVNGPSHAEGGVPFTVQGKSGYEMEGGEFIVNKKSTEAFLPLLEQINSFGRGSIPARRSAFANGGIVPQSSGPSDSDMDIQPTIAYITEEQLLKRSNTRVTNDIRKTL